MDIFFDPIYRDHVVVSTKTLKFIFVDKRLKIPKCFISSLEHYYMNSYETLKFGAFRDEIIPIDDSSWKYSFGHIGFAFKAMVKKFDRRVHLDVSYMKT